jgi:hypothetical protein
MSNSKTPELYVTTFEGPAFESQTHDALSYLPDRKNSKHKDPVVIQIHGNAIDTGAEEIFPPQCGVRRGPYIDFPFLRELSPKQQSIGARAAMLAAEDSLIRKTTSVLFKHRKTGSEHHYWTAWIERGGIIVEDTTLLNASIKNRQRVATRSEMNRIAERCFAVIIDNQSSAHDRLHGPQRLQNLLEWIVFSMGYQDPIEQKMIDQLNPICLNIKNLQSTSSMQRWSSMGKI